MQDWKQPPPGYGAPPGPIPPTQAAIPSSARPDNQLALISLIAGISSWIIAPVVGSIIAIVCGHMARAQIRERAGAEGGDGMAILGLVLGYVHLAVTCLATAIFLVVFFGLFTAIVGVAGTTH